MNDILLSILICTIDRRANLLFRLLKLLENQQIPEIEILIEKDNCELSIGAKRNILLNRSSGEYCCFIDDDDLVSSDYVSRIISALSSKPDCVGFVGNITFKSRIIKTFIHTLKCKEWHETDNVYYRCINHLNPVKIELAKKVGFEDLNHGEDHDYSKKLQPLLKTEVFLDDKPIYFYLDFDA